MVLWDVERKRHQQKEPQKPQRQKQQQKQLQRQQQKLQHEGVYNDLTGEWVTDRTEEYGRPIAVMLNNISDAMPQCDIGKADIVYEMKVEGGITRLLGIFNDYSNLEKLGSIRSCRPYYVTVAMEYDAIYMHYGQSPQGEDTSLQAQGSII